MTYRVIRTSYTETIQTNWEALLMTLAYNISKNDRLYVDKLIRTTSEPISDHDKIVKLLTTDPYNRPKVTSLDEKSTTTVLGSQVKLFLDDHQVLKFSSVVELLNAVESLSITELIDKFPQYNYSYWNNSEFPTDLLLKKLSPDYEIEKFQFCSDDLPDNSEYVTSDNPEDVINYFVNDDNINFEYQEHNFFDFTAENYCDQLLYLLKEKSTNKIVTSALTDEQLPIAVFASNLKGNTDHQSFDDYVDWEGMYIEVNTLPVTKLSQLTSYVSETSFENDNAKRFTTLDSRTPDYIPGVSIFLGDDFWPGYTALNECTTSGLYYDDFLGNNRIFLDELINQFNNAGLQLNSYLQKPTALLESTLGNARKNPTGQNFQSSPIKKSDIITTYEIADKQTGKILEPNISSQNLKNAMIKHIWQASL